MKQRYTLFNGCAKHRNATSACVKATPRSHLKLHRVDFWLHRMLVTPARIKFEVYRLLRQNGTARMRSNLISRLLRRKDVQKLETTEELHHVEHAAIMRLALGHPRDPQADQEVQKDLEKVGSTMSPSRTRIPQRPPACLGADAAEDLACQLAT